MVDSVNSILKNFLEQPLNKPLGVRSGGFPGLGMFEQNMGVFVGGLYPYSFAPKTDYKELLTGTVAANSTIYLQLSSASLVDSGCSIVNFGNISKWSNYLALDYERSLNLTVDQNCTVSLSGKSIYFQEVTQYIEKSGTFNVPVTLGPVKFVSSIKLANKSGTPLNYSLKLGVQFMLPYKILSPSFVKMIIYNDKPLFKAPGPNEQITWFPIIIPSSTINMETVSSRMSINFDDMFQNYAIFPQFNGTHVVTVVAQGYGFGNLPSYSTGDEQRLMKNNLYSVIGDIPYNVGYTDWKG